MYTHLTPNLPHGDPQDEVSDLPLLTHGQRRHLLGVGLELLVHPHILLVPLHGLCVLGAEHSVGGLHGLSCLLMELWGKKSVISYPCLLLTANTIVLIFSQWGSIPSM